MKRQIIIAVLLPWLSLYLTGCYSFNTIGGEKSITKIKYSDEIEITLKDQRTLSLDHYQHIYMEKPGTIYLGTGKLLDANLGFNEKPSMRMISISNFDSVNHKSMNGDKFVCIYAEGKLIYALDTTYHKEDLAEGFWVVNPESTTGDARSLLKIDKNQIQEIAVNEYSPEITWLLIGAGVLVVIILCAALIKTPPAQLDIPPIPNPYHYHYY